MNLLLISYTFPPNTGIGGRRWAKFVKYFLKNGIGINVISTKSHSLNSEWKEDIKDLKSKVLYLDTDYPEILSKVPKTIISKILYRLALIYVKLFSKGNFYDKSALIEKKLLAEVESLIVKKNITHVIITVAPFQYALFISKIIENHPKVVFVVDFRDPWINNRTSYGFEQLNSNRKEFEIQAEKKVVEKFHYVVSVSEYMTSYFKEKYFKTNSQKFLTFENGYDVNDFNGLDLADSFNVNEVNIVFAGTLYKKAESAFEILRNRVYDLNKNAPALLEKVNWHFYGDVDMSRVRSFNLPGKISYYGIVNKQVALSAMKSSDACLLVLTDDINYSFSTKFCEYVYYRKPIIVVSDSSSPTGSFVNDNHIGIHLHENSPVNELQAFFDQIKHHSFYKKFDASRFDVENISRNYLAFLKSVAKS